MVERRTPEQEVGVRSSLRSQCCILEQDTFTRAVPKVRGHGLILLFLKYYSDTFFIL